jgi:hypothetical protein
MKFLRRQGLLEGLWCLDEHETLSPGQLEEIDRVIRAYPHLNDDAFVACAEHSWCIAMTTTTRMADRAASRFTSGRGTGEGRR